MRVSWMAAMAAILTVACSDSDKKHPEQPGDTDVSVIQSSNGTVNSPADVAALADVNIINGDLHVGGSSVTELALPKLSQVTGNVYIADNTTLTTAALSGLTTVGGAVDVDDNPQLASLDLSALATVGQHCVVTAAAATQSILLGSLASVGGDFAITGQGSNAAVTLHAPTSVGQDMTIDGLNVTSLAFDAGTTAGDLSVSNNTALTQLTTNGALNVGGAVYVTGNHALATAAATAFAGTATTAKRVIQGNAP